MKNIIFQITDDYSVRKGLFQSQWRRAVKMPFHLSID